VQDYDEFMQELVHLPPQEHPTMKVCYLSYLLKDFDRKHRHIVGTVMTRNGRHYVCESCKNHLSEPRMKTFVGLDV